MLNNILFKYEYKKMEFAAIAQPIIDNNKKRVTSFELLSRSISIDCIERYFSSLSHSDITRISCIQMIKVAELLSVSKQGDELNIHINIHYKTLFNAKFIQIAKKIKWIKFSFEINGFECDIEEMSRLKHMFKIIKSFGHEVWLDDHGVNNATIGLLLELPWDGVKIDKSIVWRSSSQQLFALVNCCKNYANKVALEGVEDEYYYDLSCYSGADLSQGFHWGLLEINYFMQDIPILLDI